MSGRMVALSLIGLLVSLLHLLGSLLTSLHSDNCWSHRRWGHVDGVRADDDFFHLVEVSVLFLGLFSLFKGLRCGVSFWLSSLSLLLGVDIPFELVNDGDLL